MRIPRPKSVKCYILRLVGLAASEVHQVLAGDNKNIDFEIIRGNIASHVLAFYWRSELDLYFNPKDQSTRQMDLQRNVDDMLKQGSWETERIVDFNTSHSLGKVLVESEADFIKTLGLSS